MEKVVTFEAKYLSRLLWFAIIVSLVFTIIVYLKLNIEIIDVILISSFSTAFLVAIAFYLNKNEIEKIVISDEKIKIFYFNKIFFKKREKIIEKKNVQSKYNNGLIKIISNGNIEGIIRKMSADEKAWHQINTLLK